MLGKPTDREIVDAIRSGDTTRVNWAVNVLYSYKEYATRFLWSKGRYLPGLDTEFVNDLFQETIITFMEKVWEYEYDPQPGAALRTYLYQISFNKFLNERKNVYRRLEHSYDYLQKEIVEPLMPDDRLIAKEQHAFIENLLDKLGKAKADLIRMFDFEHKSHREIGELLNISEQAAKQRYYRCRLELNDLLRIHGNFD